MTRNVGGGRIHTKLDTAFRTDFQTECWQTRGSLQNHAGRSASETNSTAINLRSKIFSSAAPCDCLQKLICVAADDDSSEQTGELHHERIGAVAG